MKQPTKLMKRALQRCREWNRDYLGETSKENVTWINLGTYPPGCDQSIRVRAEDVSIGESFSWTTDEDGDFIELLGVSDDGLPMYSGKLNEEQKARWKRITG